MICYRETGDNKTRTTKQQNKYKIWQKQTPCHVTRQGHGIILVICTELKLSTLECEPRTIKINDFTINIVC